jgi:CDP-diacylglycerol--serine O-phosphatidyltransferase
VKPVAILPALCTLGNAFCGFLAIAKGADAISLLWREPTPASPGTLERFHDLFATGCWLIFLANIFDALDGRLARMTKATSDFGAMLDSLCDMLTFGAAPALMIKFLFEAERTIAEQEAFRPKLVLLTCFLYVCCAAVRLARFTAATEDDADAHDFFKGLPSPAAAGFVASGILVYLRLGEPGTPSWLQAMRGGFLWFLVGSLPAMALLMVSHVKYVHVVNRFMRGRHPHTYVGQIVLVILLLALVPEWAVALLCFGYVVACPVVSLLERLLKRPLWPGPSKPGEGGAA